MDTADPGDRRVRPKMNRIMLRTFYIAIGFLVARYIFRRQPQVVDLGRLRRAGL